MAPGRLSEGRLRAARGGYGEERRRRRVSAALLLLLLPLPLPPPAGQRFTGPAALRCRFDAHCFCCCRRPLSTAALHVPPRGGSPGSSGGCCRRRGGGSTSRAAQPGELLPAFRGPSPSPDRPHPAPGFRPRPSPAPCRRLTRAGTCSPRRAGFAGSSVPSAAPGGAGAVTSARPHAWDGERGRQAPPEAPTAPGTRGCPEGRSGPQHTQLGVWPRSPVGTQPRPGFAPSWGLGSLTIWGGSSLAPPLRRPSRGRETFL